MKNMEAKELRIGNVIYYNGMNEHDHVPNKIDAVDIKSMSESKDYLAIHEPIPLTEEWLKKIGFSDHNYRKGYTGIDVKHDSGTTLDFVLTKPEFMGPWQNHYALQLNDSRFVPVKYVHQLQNLYFAITEKELTIKPK